MSRKGTGMDDSNVDFARDLIRAFGQDRFHHALQRSGYGGHSRSFHESLAGEGPNWESLRAELKLPVVPSYLCGPASAREALCAVAFVISSNYKEFARKSPVLPACIHARMLLDEQNEWTRKYADNLAKQERDA